MSFLLPGRVADQIIRERDDSLREAGHVMDVFKRLKAVDSRIEQMWLQTADVDDPDNGVELRKGYWYLSRRNDEGQVAIFEVSGPEGEYIEPSDRLVELFQRADSWNNGGYREMERRRRERDANRKRDLERQRDDMRAQLKDEMDFRFRVQVPVTPDGRGRLTSRKGR